MRRLLNGIFILLLPMAASYAQQPESSLLDSEKLERALVNAREDVRAATDRLNRTRRDIDTERTPLLKRHQEAVTERNQLDSQVTTSEMHYRRDLAELAQLQAEVQSLRADHEEMKTALMEFRRVLETHAAAAQALELSSRLRQLDKAFHGPPSANLSEAAEQLLKTSETWNRAWQVGLRFEGVALDRRDVEVEGEFVALGPVSYFASHDRETVGPTITRPGSRMASVVPISATHIDAIEALLDKGRALVPIDPAGGGAVVQADESGSLIDEFHRGGAVMYPLLAVAAVALLLVLLKTLQLTAIRVPRREAIAEIARCVRAEGLQQAAELTGRLNWPMTDLLRVGADHRQIAREHLEEILHEQVLLKLPALERHLGTLAVLGAVAPLLGLLGTVTGMINTFDLVKLFGTGNADLLGGGISEALITTKFGLLIAVPVLLAHALLSRRVRRAVAALEHAALTFINVLKVEDPKA